MNMYEEISNNMLAIDNIDINHNYKYYMRVLENEHATSACMDARYNVEDFCEYYDIVVLDVNNVPMYNTNINLSLDELCYYLKAYENNNDYVQLIQFILSKKNHCEYSNTVIYGSRREFVTCYHPKYVGDSVLEKLEAYIFDKGNEVFICQWDKDNVSSGSYLYITKPDPSDNDFLRFAMDVTDCNKDEVYIECFEKYTKVPQYRHLEFE